MVFGKPTIPDVKPLLVAYLTKPENGVGGSLHIYIEDDNWKRHHIQFCRDWAAEHGDVDAVPICDMLLRMSKTQRIKIINSYWHWLHHYDQTARAWFPNV